ncbi:MAG: hypothetical protein QOE54_4302 [Streptosporangiaceae bacterium]|jgi:hypothetical protein|nr:hypothetical protein [Streptosporangiaceae bacterium]MDX6294627.1 hypothetical protein [Kribbellaceae bacterium]MDX6431936.1 hypothetical protein [Streptosporangiaceae bacterium]
MSTYVFSYRAPKTYNMGTTDAVAAWSAWFEQLGANLVDRGNPVFERSTVGNCGADTALTGYSLVTADDIEAAVALAKGCPILENDCGVEVGEITVLNRGTRAIDEDSA